MSRPDHSLRRATDADRDEVIALCRDSLGWDEREPFEEFFAWKHDENPFGPSPSWVATDDDGTIVGLRAFLRWRFVDPSGVAHDAVRAVDTATHPAAQGRGIFTALTTGALPELQDDGVGFVFNTPNDKSRPGYLRMGWSHVGQVPVAAAVRAPAAIARLRGARAPADLWSQPCTSGIPASTFFGQTDEVERLLAARPTPRAIATELSPAFLHWRYRFEPLHYRVLPLGDRHADGAIVFRVRRRGTATEAAICNVFAGPSAKVGRGVRAILADTGADYAVGTTSTVSPRHGCIPVPRMGPILTWRPLARAGVPAMSGLALSLGDIELF